MALAGQAVMMNWCDVVPGGRDRFYAWHTRHHMADRVGMAGFRRGRRFGAVDAGSEFFFLYEVDSISVLESHDYLTRLNNPTPITAEGDRLLTNGMRVLATVRQSLGAGQGGALATLRFAGGEDADKLDRALLQDALPRLLDRPALAGIHLLTTDLAATTERGNKPAKRKLPDRVVLIEGFTPEAVEEAAETILAVPAIPAAATETPVKGIYRQEVAIEKMVGWRP